MSHFLHTNHMFGTVQQLSIHLHFSFKTQLGLLLHKAWLNVEANKLVLAIVLTVSVFLSPPLTFFAESPVVAAATTDSAVIIVRTDAETYYLSAVNELRSGRGLPLLKVDSRLSTSALQKGNDMVLQNYWGHYAPSGNSFSDYIWGTSPKADTVGENLARCFATREEAFDALVASPTHYANMAGSYTNFGVSEVLNTTSGCTYTTMHFAQYGN